MKEFNHKCIEVCSSMKVNINYLRIDYHSFSFTDDVYFLFYLQNCQHLCQQFTIPMYIIVYNYIIQWL